MILVVILIALYDALAILVVFCFIYLPRYNYVNFSGDYDLTKNMTKKNINYKIGRDARTGEFIKVAEARRKPNTTVVETIRRKK
jgi:hypothetical protein